MSCKLGDKCDNVFACNILRPDCEVLGCNFYKPKKEQTNEEWLRSASTEETEHAITMLIMKDRFFADKEFAYVNIRFGVHCWLKEKHTD